MTAEQKRDPDDRVKLPDDADATLRALLAVDPDDKPPNDAVEGDAQPSE